MLCTRRRPSRPGASQLVTADAHPPGPSHKGFASRPPESFGPPYARFQAIL